MAIFAQSNQLSPVQGTAGNVSVVEDRTPTLGSAVGNAVESIGGMFDAAGTVYGENRAKSFVREEVENIDSAIAAAEKDKNAFGDDVPDSVKMDQKEWDILATAVRNGEMSREKARLIASSRVRTRISEEPFFADRMRKAASGVLGFNIESESARQYFASLPTEASLASGDNVNQDILDMQQMAAEESRLTGIPADKIYRQMFSLRTAERKKELALNRREAGIISDKEAFTEFNTENAKTAFTGVMGELKTIYDEEGAVKPEVYNRKLADAKAQELQELSQIWTGDQTDPAYSRAQSVIEDRYKSYRSIMEAVDYDKLNEIIIDRNKNERTIFTDEFFSDVKMINEVSGQEGVRAYFDSMSSDMNETERRQLFEQFPILGRLHSLANASPGEIQTRLNTTTRKFFTDEPLDEADEEVVDVVATKIHDNNKDKPEVQTDTFDKLVKEGKKYKMVSIVAKRPPSGTSVENQANVKRYYEEEMPDMVKTLARQVTALGQDVNQFGEAAVEMSLDAEGKIQVNSLRPLSLPQGKLNELKNTAAKINQFATAHKNNWGKILGETKEQYGIKLNTLIEEGKGQANAQINATTQDNFTKFVNSGAENKARDLYEQMKAENPDAFTTDFEIIYNTIRQKKLEAIEKERRGE